MLFRDCISGIGRREGIVGLISVETAFCRLWDFTASYFQDLFEGFFAILGAILGRFLMQFLSHFGVWDGSCIPSCNPVCVMVDPATFSRDSCGILKDSWRILEDFQGYLLDSGEKPLLIRTKDENILNREMITVDPATLPSGFLPDSQGYLTDPDEKPLPFRTEDENLHLWWSCPHHLGDSHRILKDSWRILVCCFSPRLNLTQRWRPGGGVVIKRSR